ncbi:MAG: MerR family transcriptional regulator [Croceicoccus sp.]|nr:MerR family transcriptional regulator [Croceicoccus sp.]MAL27101.1 MerR family transcriptional regulator [Croceicoccus sp.]|tara:strand:+ start:529 stop:996 length:468 start_codon:yes stop_codon:yes gene_type:complete
MHDLRASNPSSAEGSGAADTPLANGADGGADGDNALMGIQDVARKLGVTLRTLRFYEKEGLIKPERVGTTRVYTRREIARMQLILRGKRLGFSIREIGEFLDLYDADPEHQEQMQRLIDKVRERLSELEEQRVALELTIEELTVIEQEAAARLKR